MKIMMFNIQHYMAYKKKEFDDMDHIETKDLR